MYQYALESANLITTAEVDIVEVLLSAQHCDALVELLDKVQITRRCVLEYLQRQIDRERKGAGGDYEEEEYPDHGGDHNQLIASTLTEAAEELGSLLAAKKTVRGENAASATDADTATRVCYFQTRSVDDTMLFRLIVTLRLCLVG